MKGEKIEHYKIILTEDEAKELFNAIVLIVKDEDREAEVHNAFVDLYNILEGMGVDE